MADTTRADALRDAAERGLKSARAGDNEDKIASAAVQAMTVGALKVEDLDKDAALQGVLGRKMDIGALGRGLDQDDAEQLAVARAALKAVAAYDPERLRNFSKNENLSKVRPSAQEINTAVASKKTVETESERRGWVEAAKGIREEIAAQLGTIDLEIARDQAAGRPVTAKEDQVQQLQKAIESLDQTMQRHTNAQAELAQMTRQLTEAEKRGADAAAVSALKGAIDRLKSGLKDMESDLAKQTAAMRGQKFDDGKGKRQNRGGGRV